MPRFTETVQGGTGMLFRNPFTAKANATNKAPDTSKGPQSLHRYNDLPKELKEMIVGHALDDVVAEPSTVFHNAVYDRSNLDKYKSAKLDMHILSQALSNSSDNGDELIAPLKELDKKLNTELERVKTLRRQHGRELRAVEPESDHPHHLLDASWRLAAKLDEIQETQRQLACTLDDVEYLFRTKRDARKQLASLQRANASKV